MDSQSEASEEHFIKTNNDVTINENVTNSDVDFTVPNLEKDYEIPAMEDVSIFSNDFDGNELCSAHIETEENIQEMSNDMPAASNEESTTGLASCLIDELIQFTGKREKLQEERFSKSVLQKIEDDHHSKSKDKMQQLSFCLKHLVIWFLKMFFFTGFLKE